MLFAEHRGTVCICLFLLLLLRLVELLLCLLVFTHLFLKNVKVLKVRIFQGSLLEAKFLLHTELISLLLWRHRLLGLNGGQALSLAELLLEMCRRAEPCWHLLLLGGIGP